MQKRLCFGCCIKIATFVPKYKVRDKTSACGNVLAKLFVLVSKKGKPAKCVTGNQYNKERRKNSTNSAAIKIVKTERVALEAIENNGGNQKSGDDKKYIYANESAL